MSAEPTAADLYLALAEVAAWIRGLPIPTPGATAMLTKVCAAMEAWAEYRPAHCALGEDGCVCWSGHDHCDHWRPAGPAAQACRPDPEAPASAEHLGEAAPVLASDPGSPKPNPSGGSDA